MNNIEDEIEDYVYNNGLSKSSIKLINENIEELSSEFLTDVIAENASLYTEHMILVDYLSKIWGEGNNSSPHLLNYIVSVLHRIFYLAREYPLGKKVPDYLHEEINSIHLKLCNFRSVCLDDEIFIEEYDTSAIQTYDELLSALSNYPKLEPEILEMLRILSLLLYKFILNDNQKLKNIDELSMFLSRCLILWRLKSLTDNELTICFEQAHLRYNQELDLNKFEQILALEIQNYQFLQYGINHNMVKLISKTFYDKSKK